MVRTSYLIITEREKVWFANGIIQATKGELSLSRRIIFHLGPWKTGSSSLQYFLFANHKNLLVAGVLYPKGLFFDQAHHEIPNTITHQMKRFVGLSGAAPMQLKEIVNRYYTELKSSTATTLLLSSEDFAGLRADHFRELLDMFPPDEGIVFEFVYFDFDPKERLISYKNQMIKQGEYVDEKALKSILERLKSVIPNLESAIEGLPAVIHRIDYSHLKNSTDIYDKFLSLVLNRKMDLDYWNIPTARLNSSLPSTKLETLNQFNRVNVGEREFDSSCPVVYSNSFPDQALRLNLYLTLLYEAVKLENIVAEQDLAEGTTSSKLLAPFSKLTRFLQSVLGEKRKPGA